jgi:hypothetical protein
MKLYMLAYGALWLLALIAFTEAESKGFSVDAVMEKYGYEPATPEQVQLVRNAQKALGLENQRIHVVSHTGELQAETLTRSGEHVIAVCKTKDQLLAQAIIYHELGHVLYNDHLYRSLMEAGEITYEDVVSNADLQSMRARIRQYVSSGIGLFNNTTTLGGRVARLIDEQGKAALLRYTAPTFKQSNVDLEVLETQEHRADLFAADKLIKELSLGPLASLAYDLLHDAELSSYPADIPVSYQERKIDTFALRRILCIAGFLAEKKTSIVQIMKDLREKT